MPCKSMLYSVAEVRKSSSLSSHTLIGVFSAVAGTALILSAKRKSALPSQASIQSPKLLQTELNAAIRKSRTPTLTLTAIKSSALRAVAEVPFAIESDAAILGPLKALLASSTTDEANRAQTKLLRAIEISHTKVFGTALKAAALNSIRAIGFSSVTILSGSAAKVRLVAENSEGKRIHAEINPGESGEPSIAAEVVGTSHDESHQILDALLEAFADEGLRAAGPPLRKGSGGVIPAHRAHSHEHNHSNQTHSHTPKLRNTSRRASRLNSKSRQRSI